MPSPTTDIAYTLGEPGGIGADIILQLSQQKILDNIVCIGDKRVLKNRAKQLSLPIELLAADAELKNTKQLRVLDVPINNAEIIGQTSIDNVAGILTMLNTAIDGCLSRQFVAMLTGPLHKGIINQADIPFSGHTEYIAERCQAPLPVMMLASNRVRVALVTTHLPLSQVSKAITTQLIKQVCLIVEHDLRSKFGIKKPRLLVCGLNPHAGEEGHLGMEEIEIITPALDELRQQGISINGPLPADTLFTSKVLASGDIAIAMYHDQGLPVLKSQSFGEAANITLGLPIIRTSVDHGTAFDLAGTGKADIGSLKTALAITTQMTQSKTA